MKRLTFVSMVVGIAAAFPMAATALDNDYVPDAAEEALEAPPEGRPDGWTHTVDFGAGLQIGTSSHVPGQADGTTLTISGQFSYLGELWRGNHELRLSGALTEAISRTPVFDEFIKSADSLEVEAIYFYHIPAAPWFGPFARAAMRTALFSGYDFQGEEVSYLQDGEIVTANRIRLTTPFKPTYLKQSVGVFARPFQASWLSIDTRLGLGMREVIANGTYIVTDNADTPEIELSTLNTSFQTGAEFAVELNGSFNEGSLTYGAFYEMLIPFYDSTNDNLKAIDATNYEIGARVGARLTSWASVQYELSAMRIPQVVEDWQVTNMLLLSFNYGFRRGVGVDEE